MNKIFRSLILHPAGFKLELLPRENSLKVAVERCIDNPAIAGDYSWEVHELTIMGDSARLVTGQRKAIVNYSIIGQVIIEDRLEQALKARRR